MDRSWVQETDELSIIASAAQGDREAYGVLYERYVDKVYRHIYYLTANSVVAEDLTAQTFLRALEAIYRYEVRGVPFLAWLIRIAHNLTLNYRKQQKNNGSSPLPEDLEAHGNFSSPEEVCEAKIDGEHIWQVVRRLREEQRQVILMRFIDDLSYPDIAHILGKSIGAVRVIQHRALSALRHTLAQENAAAAESTAEMSLEWSPA